MEPFLFCLIGVRKNVRLNPMDLAVQTREKFGKAVKYLRREGLIPAELYGHGVLNLHLAVAAKDFSKILKEAGTSTVINLLIDNDPSTSSGQRRRPALIHDVVRDYLTDSIIHVDFYQVKMDEKIKAKVVLEFLGSAPAVKDQGGILNRVMSEVEVEALPAALPHSLSVDLSVLDELNKSIYIKDLSIPGDVEVLVEPETVVATVTPPAVEEKKIEEEPVDVGDVKVETEEKKAEREARSADSISSPQAGSPQRGSGRAGQAEKSGKEEKAEKTEKETPQEPPKKR